MYDFDKQQIIEPKRQFTGVWLPREVLEDERLKGTEKILYAEIASFGEKGCWKKSEELMSLTGMRTSAFQASCRRLVEFGYITQSREYGRMVRRSNIGFLADPESHPVEKQRVHPVEKQRVHPVEKQRVHIDNTIDNTKNNINSEVSKKLLDLLNEKTKRNFRILPRGYKETLKKFSLEEIGKALDILVEDDWHSKKINELKSDYLLRASTIDNMLSKRKKQPEGMADLDELMGDGSWMT
nr:MAG TPA: Replication initiator A family protein [Caudoviricetes sp.]